MKIILSSSFKHIASPGFIPENIAVIASYLVIPILFFLDVGTNAAISFHIFYIFSLVFIALHSSRTSLVTGAVALSIFLQGLELLFFKNQTLSVQIYPLLIIAFSNSACAILARYSRTNTLETTLLSTIDPLTQLFNRRVLENSIMAEVARQRRYGGTFSVALIDLDGFKGLNDTRGHQAGDEALVLLADILRNQTRQSDMIFRLGGDEFVILMPNTEAVDCDALCHLLCHTIGTKMTEIISHSITASVGFTTVENSRELGADILSITDSAMYKAKSIGKGRVIRGYA